MNPEQQRCFPGNERFSGGHVGQHHEFLDQLVRVQSILVVHRPDTTIIAQDDFALRQLDTVETADLYELVTARHRKGSMLITSNRDPSEWLAQMADPLLAQALVDRFTNNAYDLVVEGESYRRRQKPKLSADA